MTALGAVLLWGSLAFLLGVAAAYVGALLALRSYHEDEPPSPGDVVRMEEE